MLTIKKVQKLNFCFHRSLKLFTERLYKNSNKQDIEKILQP